MLLSELFQTFFFYVEHFIVWSKTAAVPDFLKLLGKIEKGIDAGTYTLRVNNVWDENFFKGEKRFTLMQTNKLGGKNYFLAVCYIIVGSVCIVFSAVVTLSHLQQRNVGKR